MGPLATRLFVGEIARAALSYLDSTFSFLCSAHVQRATSFLGSNGRWLKGRALVGVCPEMKTSFVLFALVASTSGCGRPPEQISPPADVPPDSAATIQAVAPPEPAMIPILVSRKAFDSEEAFDLIWSNLTVVDLLLAEGFDPARISRPALLSSRVVFYDRQVHNGGFPQFLYNSGAKPKLIATVREGLSTIGGAEHVNLFDGAYRFVEALPEGRLAQFLDGSLEDYASDQLVRDLHKAFDGFYELPELTARNAAYLRAQPSLEPLPMPQLVARLEELLGHPIAEGDKYRTNKPEG